MITIPRGVDFTASVAVRDVPWTGLQPIGHAINRGGSVVMGTPGLDTKTPIFATAPDPMRVPHCSLVLTKSLTGGVTSVRYPNEDIHLSISTQEFKRDQN
jgi:hypothetical protein